LIARVTASPQNPILAVPEGLVRLGKIARPHGLRGAVRVILDNADSAALQTVEQVILEHGGTYQEYRVRTVARAGGNALRVEFANVTTCEAAEALRGAIIFVAASVLPPPGEDEFYDFDAIGCTVATTEGNHLGVVAEIFATGANDVLVVRDGTVEVLIPVIADVVKHLDFASRRITIDAIPGLLD
jgi:16S rRNA processing protein RimM